MQSRPFNPASGARGLVYFTSHRSGHYRVYSPEQDGYWYWMGSRFEAHARHAAHVYVTRGDELRVAWLLASEVNWQDYGAVISTYSDLPEGTGAHIHVTVQQPREFTIAIRIPPWAANAGAPGRRYADRRQRRRLVASAAKLGWDPNCRRILRTHPAFGPAPDGSAWAWIQRGPTVAFQPGPETLHDPS